MEGGGGSRGAASVAPDIALAPAVTSGAIPQPETRDAVLHSPQAGLCGLPHMGVDKQSRIPYTDTS